MVSDASDAARDRQADAPPGRLPRAEAARARPAPELSRGGRAHRHAAARVHPRRPLGRRADGSRPPVPRPRRRAGRRAGDDSTRCRSRARSRTARSSSPCTIRSSPSAGDLALALYGSFLPRPSRARSATGRRRSEAAGRRGRRPADGRASRSTRDARRARSTVTNRGDRPIQVGSHYHFIETNARSSSIAPRPTACASTFRPAPPCASSRARRRPSTLVAIAGERVIRGGNALADGPVTDEGARAQPHRQSCGRLAPFR